MKIEDILLITLALGFVLFAYELIDLNEQLKEAKENCEEQMEWMCEDVDCYCNDDYVPKVLEKESKLINTLEDEIELLNKKLINAYITNTMDISND